MGACVSGMACCQPPECLLRACMSGFLAFSFLPQGGHFIVEPEDRRVHSKDSSGAPAGVDSTGSAFCRAVASTTTTSELPAAAAQSSSSSPRRTRGKGDAKYLTPWDDKALLLPLPPLESPDASSLESPDAGSLELPSRAQTVPTPLADFTPVLVREPKSSTELYSFRKQTHASASTPMGSLSDAFNRLRATSNMGTQLQDDPDVMAKSRNSQRLQMWKVRGAAKPIWEFYEMISPLGGGAFGTVQKWQLKQVVDDDEDRCVAVKHIKWSDISGGCFRNKEDEQLVRRELKMLLVLDHPFIVKFREWFEHPCLGIFFVMELCHGRPLQVILEDVCGCGPLEERLAHTARLRRYFREAVYAVSYIHSFKPPVVHRDLKPDNILLKDESRNSCVKLIDFGLAVHRAHASEYSGGMWQQGTPLFMAPEAFLNREGDFTPEIDIWALGVIFSWIVTAMQRGTLQHPMLPEEEGEGFNVRPVPDLFYAYRDQEPWRRELFAGQPPAAFELADLILVHDSSLRPSAARILQAEWVRSGDPAAAASAQVLKNANLRGNIETYQDLTHLEKRIIHVVAEKASDSDVRGLRRTFRAMDTNGDGRLSKQEILDGFRRNDIELAPETLEDLFAELDEDNSGDITYHEWLAATLGQKVLLAPSAVGSAFNHLDSSGTGFLTLQDLQVVIGEAEAEAVLSSMSTEFSQDQPVLSYEDFKRIVGMVADKRQPMSMKSISFIEASEAVLPHISPSGLQAGLQSA